MYNNKGLLSMQTGISYCKKNSLEIANDSSKGHIISGKEFNEQYSGNLNAFVKCIQNSQVSAGGYSYKEGLNETTKTFNQFQYLDGINRFCFYHISKCKDWNGIDTKHNIWKVTVPDNALVAKLDHSFATNKIILSHKRKPSTITKAWDVLSSLGTCPEAEYDHTLKRELATYRKFPNETVLEELRNEFGILGIDKLGINSVDYYIDDAIEKLDNAISNKEWIAEKKTAYECYVISIESVSKKSDQKEYTTDKNMADGSVFYTKDIKHLEKSALHKKLSTLDDDTKVYICYTRDQSTITETGNGEYKTNKLIYEREIDVGTINAIHHLILNDQSLVYIVTSGYNVYIPNKLKNPTIEFLEKCQDLINSYYGANFSKGVDRLIKLTRIEKLKQCKKKNKNLVGCLMVLGATVIFTSFVIIGKINECNNWREAYINKRIY